jgi:mRNA interferase MazF
MGAEMRKTRPCLIVSPDEINENLQTVIIAPMTSAIHPYPSRISVRFQGKNGQVALDQLRAVDQTRLLKKLGILSASAAQATALTLVEMFNRQ